MTEDREIAPGDLADDDDELDGSGVDYTEDPVADDDLHLVVLSPEGDPEKIRQYAQLFGTEA
jgi:hypothetical protein